MATEVSKFVIYVWMVTLPWFSGTKQFEDKTTITGREIQIVVVPIIYANIVITK